MTENGRLDTASLTLVDGWAYLERRTAAAWNAACDDMQRLGFARPTITAPDGGYRTYLRQLYWKTYWTDRGKPGNAATPGFSDHGWGTAVDIWNVAKFPRQILVTVFAAHGLHFNIPHEPWHAQHNGTTTAGTGTPIGDDMDLLDPIANRNPWNPELVIAPATVQGALEFTAADAKATRWLIEGRDGAPSLLTQIRDLVKALATPDVQKQAQAIAGVLLPQILAGLGDELATDDDIAKLRTDLLAAIAQVDEATLATFGLKRA